EYGALLPCWRQATCILTLFLFVLFGFALSSAGHVSPVGAGVGGSFSLRPPSLLPTFRMEHMTKSILDSTDE
ncbi:unnamed protein product, partial [Ectocarpus sp. 8 AP-2014]